MESKIFAKLNFDPGILVILSLVLTIVLIVVVIMLLIRQSRLEMNYKVFMKGKTGKSLEETFRQELDNLDLVHEQTELLHKRMMYVEKSLAKSYQKCGIVRYDAFKELGGKLSFSYALLNDSNSGFVMNCIHSREGSYTYIKDIIRGECDLPLSAEESEAIQKAIESATIQAAAKKSKNESSDNSDISITETIKNRVKVPSGITENIAKRKKKTASSKKAADTPKEEELPKE